MKSLFLIASFLFTSTSFAQIPMGKTPIYAVNYKYSTGNVSSGAWREIVTQIPSSISMVDIQDTSGQVMQLGVGSSGNEVAIPFYITRGGNGALLFQMNAYQRISVRAANSTGTATTGELLINFFQ